MDRPNKARRHAAAVTTWAVTVATVLVPVLVGAHAAEATVVPATWTSQGPGPTTGGQVEGLGAQSNPVVGAVEAIVTHPTDPDIMWAGGVNGGIWRTNNATASAPTWVPETDQSPGLSIGDIQLDPTAPSGLVLVAAVGGNSAFNVNGPVGGILRTTNGGNSWTPLAFDDLAGENLEAVAPRGTTIVVSSNAGLGGVWRSTDGGTNFTRLSGNGTSGLPNIASFDLVGDPANNARLYVATRQGIFRSTDTGATWTNVSGTGFGGVAPATLGGGTVRIEMAVHNNTGAGTNALYVGAINAGQLAGLFRTPDQGATWTQLDTPTTNEGGVVVGLHPGEDEDEGPGGQGATHFSITADPTNANLVYVGGDRQPQNPGPNGILGDNDDTFPNSIGANNFSGRLFRCNASLAPGAQCANITHSNTSGNSAPHADSRDMAFDANGDLMESDDGGVYRQTDPTTNTGNWVSAIGNLAVTEHHSCEWDSVSDVIICGNQDTGVTEQTATGNTTWRQVFQADGGIVGVNDSGASSVRFASTQRLGGFARRTCNAANVCGAPTGVGLSVGGGQVLRQVDTIGFYQPYVLNAITPARMVIPTGNVWESTDQGANLTNVGTLGGARATRALAYGGRSGGIDNPDVLYIGDNAGGLWLRTSSGGAVNQVTAYPGGSPVDITLDPNDWLTAYVIDSNQVFVTNDAGSTWNDVTGNLPSTNAGALRSVAFVPGSGFAMIAVGTDSGVFVTQTQHLGTWAELGANLPNTLTFDLNYDAADDVLVAGTLGRGSWTLSNASAVLPTADLRIEKSDDPDPVHAGEELFYTLTITNDGPDTALGVVVTDQLPDAVTYLSDNGGCSFDIGTNDLTCDLGDLPNGAVRTITIKTLVRSSVVSTEPDGTALIDNVATVASVSVDPDLSNNTVSEKTFVQELADLEITKLCKPDGPLQAGDTATCTIFVDNHGPSDARNVTVTDTHLASGPFTIGTVTASQGSCDPPSGGVITCHLGTLAAASPTSSGRATITIEITATDETDVNDVATVTSSTPDPDTTNNQGQGTIHVSGVADLALTKTGPATAVAGTNATYTLGVTNNGPSTAKNVIVEDLLPAEVHVVSVTGTGGATCNASIPGNPLAPTTCSFGPLASGASRTMTIVVTIDPAALGILHDDARASSGTFDPDLSDNLATFATTVSGEADLSTTKTATPNPLIAGTPLSYQVTVTNGGPSVAHNVVLTDPLSSSLVFVSATASTPGSSCGFQTNTNTVECELGDLDPGDYGVVTITTNVKPSTGDSPPPITNTATAHSSTPDPVPANNAGTVTTNVITRADLGIVLTSNLNIYKPSKIIHYLITVTNYGPSDAQNVVVTQILPPAKVAIYDSNSAGCPAPSGQTFTCSLGTLRFGESRTFQLNVLIRGNKRTITQTATVASTTTDPNPVNNSSTRVVTVK